MCALIAGAAAFVGAIMLVALHVLPASRGLDPMSEPLSAYAFAPDGWLFDGAVLALAVGLAFLVSSLVRGGCFASRSPARVLLTACSLSLVLVVVFPEHDSNGAVRIAGRIHWIAAMLAFGALTAAPALLGRHRISLCSRLITLARRVSAGTGPCFLLVLAASLANYETPLLVPAWSFGLGERVLVTLELVLAGVLTAWAWRGCRCHANHLVTRERPWRAIPDHSAQSIDGQHTTPSVGQLPTRAAADEGDAQSTGLVA